MYSYNTMTISVPENGEINSINIFTPSGEYVVHANCKTDKGTIRIQGSQATIFGIESNEVTFTNRGEGGHVRILSVTVEYTINENILLSPTLPASCDFEGSKQITIKNNAEGATIYYTIDGTDPSASSTPYTTAFTVDETTTVKAIAIKNGIASAISEASYNHVVIQSSSTITAKLTSNEVMKTPSKDYNEDNKVESTSGVWTGFMQINDRSLQISNSAGYHVQSPEFPGKIVSVSVTFTSGTSATSPRGIVIMPSTYTGTTADALTTGNLGLASYNGVENPTSTVELTGDATSFKIYATGGAIYFSQVEVVYEKPADHVLSVGSTGWATLYLGLDARIPEDLACYTISSATNGLATLLPIIGTLPAHTGIIVKATPNTAYTFQYNNTYSGNEEVENLLKGSFTNAYISGGGYVLSKVNDVVGLYKAKQGTDGTFLNNAYKAYLPASAVSNTQQSNGLRFVVEGTTDIEVVQPTQSSEYIIYDLMGRRVEKMEKGIYIVNGRKVLNH